MRSLNEMGFVVISDWTKAIMQKKAVVVIPKRRNIFAQK